ncbi:hypothetical protein CLU96_2526 [Chryseobacterium sp. 52]|uniref:hypothetical protein n=1 Tax=Chryseobacterium sp. 52 TaxID=2035213 RepID=UPI000C18B6C7|nr:hypothetical protein [Chryseobacterium sp. 52]PIF45517.1 hypothetical protein CLU96_2526 [Chryseobacterium sp. 52]
MSELLRIFTTRAVEMLSPSNIKSFGIESHPVNYQSDRFKSWQLLCRENNVSMLNGEMLQFLKGKDSIKKIDDLGKEWTKAITDFRSVGNQLDKNKAYQIIKEARLDTVFNKEKNLYFLQRTAVSDTILCLLQLKNLSHPSNMDYLSVLTVMTFVEKCYDLDMKLPDHDILKYFDKQILTPSCFSKLDLCNTGIRATEFPFLGETGALTEAKIPGCINEKCICKVNDACVPQSKCCAKPRIDVVDLMLVKDYTKSYLAGDLSYIKNILEGEELATKHRRLERTEELIETEEEIKQFEEKYLQTEDKASLQKETENIVKQDSAFEAGVTANADWGTYKIQADSKYNNNQSKSLTNKEIVNSSKEIVDRATKQVEEKVRKLVSTKRIFETEEINEHSFNNVNGTNISGQYLYVNKLSRAQVYNYGRKAVIDLVLPEPAALYKRLFETKFQGTVPVKPTDIDIKPDIITPENYKTLISKYGIKDAPNPPDFFTEIVVALEGEPGDPKGKKKSGSWTSSFPCPVPANYAAISMHVVNIRLNYNEGGGVSINASLGPNGDSMWHQDGGLNNLGNTVPLPAIEGNQMVNVHAWDVTNFKWDLIVKCKLKDEFKQQWQMSVFAKITEVYDKAMEKYNKEFAEYQKNKEAFDLKEEDLKKERYNKNPFINRETEKSELKRMVISYISCQFFDQFDAMKNRVEPCGYPEMNIREAEQQGKFIQFFEQAFNWNLITYIFYPYFWGKKCSWSEKLKEESNDLIFKKFLEAGSCRVLVPIRDGYFDYVSYFISSGEIWGGAGMPPLPNDPHYVSVAQEIKEQKENFYSDREGALSVVNASNTVILSNTDHYWDYAMPGVSTLKINADIDREIIIDCKVYRIVSIAEDISVSTHTSWIITIERNYEGATASNLKWSTGAVFIGAPWEFVTPTTLTFLRDKSKCLPSYPLKNCLE